MHICVAFRSGDKDKKNSESDKKSNHTNKKSNHTNMKNKRSAKIPPSIFRSSEPFRNLGLAFFER